MIIKTKLSKIKLLSFFPLLYLTGHYYERNTN